MRLMQLMHGGTRQMSCHFLAVAVPYLRSQVSTCRSFPRSLTHTQTHFTCLVTTFHPRRQMFFITKSTRRRCIDDVRYFAARVCAFHLCSNFPLLIGHVVFASICRQSSYVHLEEHDVQCIRHNVSPDKFTPRTHSIFPHYALLHQRRQ
jgi:hypothetical protein